MMSPEAACIRASVVGPGRPSLSPPPPPAVSSRAAVIPASARVWARGWYSDSARPSSLVPSDWPVMQLILSESGHQMAMAPDAMLVACRERPGGLLKSYHREAA